MPLTLSDRALGIAPSVTLAINATAAKLRAEGKDVIAFGAGEPDFNTPAYICAAAKEAVDKGITRYTPASGTVELRNAVCEKLKHDNGLDYKANEVIISNGAKQVLFTCFATLLNPGDEVIVTTPCWLSYPEMVRMAGGVVVEVHADEATDFVPPIEAIEAAVTEKTKAFVLNSPNNPNGCVWSEAQIRALAELAIRHDFYIISDEIYEKLIYDGCRHFSPASISREAWEHTITVNGVSKSYAMTGWRIGYAAGPANVIKAMGSYQSHAASGPNSIAQYATVAALKGGDACVTPMVQVYDERRKLLHSLLNNINGLSCRLPKGAFYIMLNLTQVIGKKYHGEVITGSGKFAELLLNSKYVAVVPALAFGDDNFVRLSYATSTENIINGCKRIAEFASEIE